MACAAYRHFLFAAGLLAAVSGVDQARAEDREGVSAPTDASHPLDTLATGHVLVFASVDGSPARRFVVDTAASRTTITPKLRAEMPGLRVGSLEEPLDGAVGRIQVETATVEYLQVAGHVFGSRDLLLLPPGPVDRLDIDGILGADILADFVVDMDIPRRRWRMIPKIELSERDGYARAIPFTIDDHRAPRLEIRLNGIAVPAMLDTGASGTIINWPAARAIGLSPASAELIEASDIKGATNHGTESVEARLDTLAIGDITVRETKVRIADLAAFGAAGFQFDQPAVILGIDILSDRRFVIDYPARRLHISASVSPNPD